MDTSVSQERVPFIFKAITVSLSLSLILRPTVSRPVCLGIKHLSGAYGQIFISQRIAGLLMWGTLSDERTSMLFTIALALASSYFLFTVSGSRLPFSSPPTTRRVTVEVFDPASIREVLRESYITTDCQSASLSWCQAPIWGLTTRFLLLSDNCGFVDVGRSL
jgi:hypothetical protein